MNSSRKTFQIIGGGFSGMALAWYLQSSGARVQIFERSFRLGGKIVTLNTPFGLVEQAANALLASKDVEDLCRELQLELIPKKKLYPQRYIFRGEPSRYPLRGKEWLKVPRVLRERARGFTGIQPRPQETVWEWSNRHWGEGISTYLVEPALQGIFAAPSRELSASLCLRGLFSPLEKGLMRGSVAPAGGMEKLISTWTLALLRKGVDVHLNYHGDELPPGADKTLLCLSPQDSAAFLHEDEPKFLDDLKMLPRVGLTSVTLVFEKDPSDLHGFGMLFPRSEGFRSQGVLFASDIFHDRKDKKRLETYILDHPDSLPSDVETLTGVILKDRRRFQPDTAKPLAVFVKTWPEALPLYGRSLEKFLSQYSLDRGKYRIFGTSYGALGLSRILSHAKEVAKELMESPGCKK